MCIHYFLPKFQPPRYPFIIDKIEAVVTIATMANGSKQCTMNIADYSGEVNNIMSGHGRGRHLD